MFLGLPPYMWFALLPIVLLVLVFIVGSWIEDSYYTKRGYVSRPTGRRITTYVMSGSMLIPIVSDEEEWVKVSDGKRKRRKGRRRG